MDTKTCKGCDEGMAVDQFYRHPETHDGRLNYCKACVKTRRKEEYRRDLDNSRAKERARDRSAHRTDAAPKHRQRYPEKYRARQAVGNAVRDGKLVKLPCEVCGDSDSEGHHEDYTKPLEVQWLCRTHHRIVEGRLIPF